jgi:hypothetical protein
MGWRDVVSDLVSEIAEGWLCSSDVEEALLRMDEPDRIALARELLPAGFVVAPTTATDGMCVAATGRDDRGDQGQDRYALYRSIYAAMVEAAMMRDVTADDLPSIKAQILNRRAMMGEGD